MFWIKSNFKKYTKCCHIVTCIRMPSCYPSFTLVRIIFTCHNRNNFSFSTNSIIYVSISILAYERPLASPLLHTLIRSSLCIYPPHPFKRINTIILLPTSMNRMISLKGFFANPFINPKIW